MRDVERMLMPSTRHLIMSVFVFVGSVFIMNIILANNIKCKHYVQFIFKPHNLVKEDMAFCLQLNFQHLILE